MEQLDLVKSFIGITCVDDYEKWNEEIFSKASEEECDGFWEWADSELFNQIWETLAAKLRAEYSCTEQSCADDSAEGLQIECDKIEFEFVPDSIQEHIIQYFCGNDLACSLILTAPLEFDIEEIEYEENILTFTGVVFDC